MTSPYGNRAAAGTILLLTLCAAASPAGAQDIGGPAPTDTATITTRTGDHAGFGRLVFDLPAGVGVQTVAEGSRILLVFAGTPRTTAPASLPRNLVHFDVDSGAGSSTVTLTLAPGSHARQQRFGDRLVVDLLDPSRKTVETAVKPTSTRTAPQNTSPEPLAQPVREPTPPAQPTAAHATPIQPQPARDAVQSPMPVSTAPSLPVDSTPLPQPAQSSNGAPPAKPDQPKEATPFVIQADATVGAAAFRRGPWGIVVLDRRLALAEPAGFTGAVITQGPVSTTLELPLPAASTLALERVPAGWSVSVINNEQPGTMAIKPLPDGVAFPMRRIGRPINILDPLTGGTLLVGTGLVASAEASLAVGRQTPSYKILPTWLGVAVEPLSDKADLHASAAEFILHGGTIPSDAVLATQTPGRLDLPDAPVPALLNRLHNQLASAADAPPRARSAARIAALQAMLSLGLGVEAQALAQHLLAEDPEAALDTRLATASGAAAVLANRPDEALAMDRPGLPDSPELDLWRGLRDRRLGHETDAARRLPGHLALALSYPASLRQRIWPDLAEAAAESGVPLPADQQTPMAMAIALEHAGKLDEAIAAWQAVADGADRRDRVRASIRLAELQLAGGRMSAAAAADIMERQSFAWRGDELERNARFRASELRAAAGEWRTALDMLRATETIFPDQKPVITSRKTAVFEAMLTADGGQLSPLDAVLLAADYADCVPNDGKDAKLAKLIADKLMALDLPVRAIPVLQGLMNGTQAGPGRAEFGARLGQILLEGGNPDSAMAALQASEAPGLADDLNERRSILAARIAAAQGRIGEASTRLASLHSAAADDLRASLLGQAGDLKGSAQALQDLADRVVPHDGPLTELAQAVVIRQASVAARLMDLDRLRALSMLLPRMAGTQADMLRVLTEPAITSVSELSRASAELKLARGIPKQIEALTRR